MGTYGLSYGTYGTLRNPRFLNAAWKSKLATDGDDYYGTMPVVAVVDKVAARLIPGAAAATHRMPPRRRLDGGPSSSSHFLKIASPAVVCGCYAVAAPAAMIADTRPVPGLGAQATR